MRIRGSYILTVNTHHFSSADTRRITSIVAGIPGVKLYLEDIFIAGQIKEKYSHMYVSMVSTNVLESVIPYYPR